MKITFIVNIPLTGVGSKPSFFIPSLTSSISCEVARNVSDTNSCNGLSELEYCASVELWTWGLAKTSTHN